MYTLNVKPKCVRLNSFFAAIGGQMNRQTDQMTTIDIKYLYIQNISLSTIIQSNAFECLYEETMNTTCFIFITEYAIVEFNDICQLQINTSILTQVRIRTVRNIDVHTYRETEFTNSFQLFFKVLKMPYRLKFYFLNLYK